MDLTDQPDLRVFKDLLEHQVNQEKQETLVILDQLVTKDLMDQKETWEPEEDMDQQEIKDQMGPQDAQELRV